ncbi:hypothetical protein [Streptomyces glomeratus]|uniref:hypothetical protein n=1 Tax=Streptomyces glomeratus TaxID=284452 RepID=UPI0022792FBF|nr:hypothetical protein [Streptomyces glomeratus]
MAAVARRTGRLEHLAAVLRDRSCSYQRLYEANKISHTTRRRIQHELDLEEASHRPRD